MNAPGINPILTSMEGWQLQIHGAMNPAIHHPSWYKMENLITPDEFDAAMKGRPAAGPLLSSFLLWDGAIECQPAAWAISGTRMRDMDGALNLAAVLFDEKLPHTPVQSYTFVFYFHAQAMEKGDIRERLAAAMGSAGIGLAPTQEAATRFSYSYSEGYMRRDVSIEPSIRGSQKIYLTFQTAHAIESQKDTAGRPVFATFSIGNRLRQDAAAARDAASAQLNRTIKALGYSKE